MKRRWAKSSVSSRCSNNRPSTCRWTCRTTCRTCPFSSNVPKEVFLDNVVARQKIHHGGRHHPGGRLAAVFHAGQGRAAGHLPRGPLHQSFALHVSAGAGRIRAGRRFAGNPCALRRRPRGNPAHRRNAPARQNAGRRRGAGKGIAGRPQGARRTRHAGGPGPQRPGPRLRFRQRAGEGPDDHRALQPRHAHRLASRREPLGANGRPTT